MLCRAGPQPLAGDASRARKWGLRATLLLCLLSPSLPGRLVAAPVEPVEVRAAVHPEFGRLVFEWPRAIMVDGRQDGERLVLRFARPLAPDLAAAADILRDYLSKIARGGDRREIELSLPPGVEATISTFEDRIVAVDLAHRTPATAAPLELRSGTHPGFVRIVLDWGRETGFEASADGLRRQIVFDREAKIDALAIVQRARHLLDAASSSHGDGRSELRLVLKPGVRAEIFEIAGTRVVIDLHEPAAAPVAAAEGSAPAASPVAMPDGKDAPVPTERTGPAAPPEPAAEPSAPPAETGVEASAALALSIRPATDGQRVALDFTWSRPLPAAFLIRAGYLWSVFAVPDGAAPDDLPSVLPSPLPGHLGPGEPFEVAGGAAIRFALRRPLAATVARAGSRWRAILDEAATPPQAVPIERAAAPPRLRIDAGEAVHLVRLTDPEVGDELVIWPLLAAGLGLPEARRLVELELLRTAQGLAWRARSDDLTVQAGAQAVELSARAGLRLSTARRPTTTEAPGPPLERRPASRVIDPADAAAAARAEGPALDAAAEGAAAPRPEPAAPEQPPIEGQGPRVADPADATGGALDLARFAKTSLDRSTLEQRIAQAGPAERPDARLELARWFLARALAPEALAVLAALGAPADPTIAAHQPAKEQLGAAAQLLLGRLDEAAAVLEKPALDGDDEIALWRAALAAARLDWPAGARELDRGKAVLAAYPPALQLRLGVPAVQAAIEAGSYDLAQDVLRGLRALELTPGQRAEVAFHEGLLLARRGVVDRAAEIWRALEQDSDQNSRIKPAYSRVQLLLEAGRLSLAEAVARLAPARALWRGHPWEARMLEGLAELYRQSGEPAAAIRTWHDLLARFPALPDAPRIERVRRETFADALAQDAAIGAVRAYALYRDFPELVAEGAAGDAMRRGLAMRLAGLDLLEPAAELLDELVGQRLSGAAKAAAGAELAALWLRAPDPAAALAALERSRVPDELPAELAQRRRLLQARALAAADRPADALALLDGRREPEPQRLRAGILWQMRAWPRLAASLEQMLVPRAPSAGVLSEEEQELVIRLAVAYDRQADHAALARLRARFGPAMRGEAGEPAFLMATMTPGRPVEPEAIIAVASEHLDRVRDYLAAEPAAP